MARDRLEMQVKLLLGEVILYALDSLQAQGEDDDPDDDYQAPAIRNQIPGEEIDTCQLKKGADLDPRGVGVERPAPRAECDSKREGTDDGGEEAHQRGE